ncbi:mitochondrial inner membrane protein domain-containing protein [Ditylenchus destructor]|uniref:MICOS complex subunit MIC60 n=1 Tax=Ditylenchus destructor TaxID=166010 RepID=A0AAD4NF57_9BILA|nr:mitochondrial inner membrane protein domain-containing protein [Ditylenchus destructor]
MLLTKFSHARIQRITQLPSGFLRTSERYATESKNPYPSIGGPNAPAKPPKSKAFKIMFGTMIMTGIGVGGMVYYGHMDPRFRKRMVEKYPWSSNIFDFFLGPFGITPYVIPFYEFKEGVKENVNATTNALKENVNSTKENLKRRFVRNVPLPYAVKRWLYPPPPPEDKIPAPTEEDGVDFLPHAIPDSFVGEENTTIKVKEPKSKYGPSKRGDKRNKSISQSKSVCDPQDYHSRLISALRKAESGVVAASSTRFSSIQKIQNHTQWLKNHQSESLADAEEHARDDQTNEESNARQAIRELEELIREGRSSSLTSGNSLILNAEATALKLTSQLNELNFLAEKARRKGDLDFMEEEHSAAFLFRNFP